MKRMFAALLAAAVLLWLLPGCQGGEPSGPTSPPPSAALSPEPEKDSPTGLSAADLTGVAFDHSGRQGRDGVESMYPDENRDTLAAYAQNVYQLEDSWEDMAVVRAAGASAFEIVVVRMGDDGAAVRAAAAFMNYISSRQGDFVGYAPAEADMVANGEILQDGAYAALFICPDPVGAGAAVEAALDGAFFPVLGPSQDPVPTPESDPEYSGRCKFTPPNVDDMSIYDTTAIRGAWEKGDPSALSEYDRAIYDGARQVLDEVLEDGMSDLEKETAVYQWMVSNLNYDWTHGDHMKETPRESFTPYGGLVEHKAVCLGFATTFQLLMDLSGVECATVVGASYQSRSDHSWNMVRLNGEWYCVDVTWDANARENGGRGRPKDWDYFNVTSEDMADSNHQWDYANTPEAAAEDRGRG